MGLLAGFGERVVDGMIAAVHKARGDKVAEDDSMYLSGLCKPCRTETPPTALTVAEGKLPAGLTGMCVHARAR
jgi:hypothetical protein